MAALNIYAVRDNTAERFLSPWVDQSDVNPCRSFVKAQSNKETMIGQYPQEHSLYRLGAFDDNTGEFINCKVKLLDGKPEIEIGEQKNG